MKLSNVFTFLFVDLLVLIICISITNIFFEPIYSKKFASCRFNYDMYYLSLQFKPGFCHNNTLCNHSDLNTQLSNTWTIHGLWPTRMKGSYDQSNCLKVIDHYHDFPKWLAKDLKYFWPSLIKESSLEKFHKHEWIKHGSCVNFCYYNVTDNMAQLYYFSKVINLRNHYDPLKYLNTTEGVMRFQTLKRIFYSKLGVVPLFICKTKYQFRLGKQFLTEIRIPLDLNFNPLTDKSLIIKQRCSNNKKIYFKI